MKIDRRQKWQEKCRKNTRPQLDELFCTNERITTNCVCVFGPSIRLTVNIQLISIRYFNIGSQKEQFTDFHFHLFWLFSSSVLHSSTSSVRLLLLLLLAFFDFVYFTTSPPITINSILTSTRSSKWCYSNKNM